MGKHRFFALKYIRLLTKTAAAQELNASTCWLLSIIACQEDVKSFSEPAKFYFSQLMPLCGFTSPKQLRSAITKAVSLGWLCYEPGSKGVPGKFSVRVPEQFANLAPYACDESTHLLSSGETQIDAMGALDGNESPERVPSKETKGERKRKRKGNTSLPISTTTPNSRSCSVVNEWIKPEGVTTDAWAEWMKARKSKRAVNSVKAWVRFVSEVELAGWTIPKAVERCIEGGAKGPWLTFKASYVANESKPPVSTLKAFVPSEERDPIKPRVRVAQ